MRFIHLSDLHLGKRVYEWPMLEDQEHILGEVLALADRERPQALLIAGDVYDKPVPPAEAVALFDRFLSALADRGLPTLIISGNHDSPERLAFGGRLMAAGGVYLAPVYSGRVAPVVLRDEWGAVSFWPLPFFKPSQVRRWFPDREIVTAGDAMEAAISAMELDPTGRNVLIAHQFVTGAIRSESEEAPVGGLDSVDVSVFQAFDYVALGHLHRPQDRGSPHVRYCGSPLKYSFSEEGDVKSATVVDLGEKGDLTVRAEPLRPLREVRTLRGTYDRLVLRETYAGRPWREDYLRVVLEDEEDVPDAAAKLRTVYPRLLRLEYDNTRTRQAGGPLEMEAAERRSPVEVFAALYEAQNGRPMSPQQSALVERLAGEAWEEGGEP